MFASENGHLETVKALVVVPDIDINMQDEVKKQVFIVCCYSY